MNTEIKYTTGSFLKKHLGVNPLKRTEFVGGKVQNAYEINKSRSKQREKACPWYLYMSKLSILPKLIAD